jgi:transposase
MEDIRLRRPERSQVVMTMQSADDLVPPLHPVRTIWQVVQSLDLSQFHAPIKARTGQAGRNATDPALLIALWLYACTRGVGSARELAKRCTESKPYQWLCGGVSLNHHTLSDFRVEHAAALDGLFTQVIASLVDQGLVTVKRVSQDGTRVRASAGAGSFRRRQRLENLLQQAQRHVAEVKALLEDPAASAELSARKKAAKKRAARERQQRVEAALQQLPELEARQQELARKVSAKQKAEGRLKEPRVSTTDAETRVMKMADGGFRPAVNVQLAVDTASRAVVGVQVIGAGVDSGQIDPMRRQVEQRTGRKIQEYLVDGGYGTLKDVEDSAAQGLSLYVPPKPPRNRQQRGSEYEPRAGESEAVKQWRERMGSAAGKEVYKERGATVETVNADLKTYRGLGPLPVRGLLKAQCVALWCALAYNVLRFAGAWTS